MKKSLLFIVVALALVVLPAMVFANGLSGESEAETPTQVEADFEFEESDGVLTITGEGEGFEFGESYISLVYGDGSLVEGPGSCEPAGNLTGNLMFVGFWIVSPNGEAMLVQTPGGASGAALDDIATISVRREAIMLAETIVDPPEEPEELEVTVFPVEACGAVDSDDDDDDDDDEGDDD